MSYMDCTFHHINYMQTTVITGGDMQKFWVWQSDGQMQPSPSE